MEKNRNWNREELILAINLYCKTPFGKIHNRNPEIINLSQLINRTPSSVSYKLANFASIDPSLPRKGASNVSKLDISVWNEFFKDWDSLVFESEKTLSLYEKTNLLQGENNTESIALGKEKERVVKTRVNQNFFRSAVLASYENCCCITGVSNKELLVASHIIPWSTDLKNRLNPRNGLCLNSLHDKAFDRGLLTIDTDFSIKISPKIKIEKKNTFLENTFLYFENKKIILPKKFLPDPEFLSFHQNEIFQKS